MVHWPHLVGGLLVMTVIVRVHAAHAAWDTQYDKGEFMCYPHDACRGTSLHS